MSNISQQLLINPDKLSDKLAQLELIKLFRKKYPDLDNTQIMSKIFTNTGDYTEQALKPYIDFKMYYIKLIGDCIVA